MVTIVLFPEFCFSLDCCAGRHRSRQRKITFLHSHCTKSNRLNPEEIKMLFWGHIEGSPAALLFRRIINAVQKGNGSQRPSSYFSYLLLGQVPYHSRLYLYYFMTSNCAHQSSWDSSPIPVKYQCENIIVPANCPFWIKGKLLKISF